MNRYLKVMQRASIGHFYYCVLSFLSLFIRDTITAIKTITNNAKTPIIIIPLLQLTKGSANCIISKRFYLDLKISKVSKPKT